MMLKWSSLGQRPFLDMFVTVVRASVWASRRIGPKAFVHIFVDHSGIGEGIPMGITIGFPAAIPNRKALNTRGSQKNSNTVIFLIAAFLFSQVGPISAAAKYNDAKSIISLAGEM